MKLLKKLPLINRPMLTPLRKDSVPNVEVVVMLVLLKKDIGEETSKTRLVMLLIVNMAVDTENITKAKDGTLNPITMNQDTITHMEVHLAITMKEADTILMDTTHQLLTKKEEVDTITSHMTTQIVDGAAKKIQKPKKKKKK